MKYLMAYFLIGLSILLNAQTPEVELSNEGIIVPRVDRTNITGT